MTIERAIEVLTDLRYFNDDCKEDVEALELAIGVLRKCSYGEKVTDD